MYNTSYQAASAVITGSEKYPDIRGLAVFVPTELGTMVSVSVYGLPKSEGECQCGVFAMHIHEGMTCTGNAEDHGIFCFHHHTLYLGGRYRAHNNHSQEF